MFKDEIGWFWKSNGGVRYEHQVEHRAAEVAAQRVADDLLETQRGVKRLAIAGQGR